MPSRQDTQEDRCQPESIPRWSFPFWELVPGMLFQSQDTPLKYSRTINKNIAKSKKSDEIHAHPTRRPGGSLLARINPQVIVSTLYISPRHAAPISRHTNEMMYFNSVSWDLNNIPGTNVQTGNDHLGIDSGLQRSSWASSRLGMDFFRFLWFSSVFQWFWCISMVSLEIGAACRGLMYKLEAITWGLILAGRDPPGRLLGWAWISSDFFDLAMFFNGSDVFQWCVLRLNNILGTNVQTGSDHLGIDSGLQRSSWASSRLGVDFIRFLWFCYVFHLFLRISMVCLEIWTTSLGLMYKLEAITWGLILACRDPPGRLLGWAWISSDFFDLATIVNGSCVYQWCLLRLEQHAGD